MGGKAAKIAVLEKAGEVLAEQLYDLCANYKVNPEVWEI
jgi:hypothetical protein